MAIGRGAIDTLMTTGHDFDRVEYQQRMFLGRPGNAEEVAKVIAFLLSDESSYVTGSVSTVDAGWTA